jgi:hypothetical protein
VPKSLGDVNIPKSNQENRTMTKEICEEIVYRINKKGPEHSDILAKAIEKFGRAVNFDVNQIANLLFGAFVETVSQQDFSDQIKRWKGSRQYMTERLFESRIWAENGEFLITYSTGYDYAKEVENVIETWDKDNLSSLEMEATQEN